MKMGYSTTTSNIGYSLEKYYKYIAKYSYYVIFNEKDNIH